MRVSGKEKITEIRNIYSEQGEICTYWLNLNRAFKGTVTSYPDVELRDYDHGISLVQFSIGSIAKKHFFFFFFNEHTNYC